MGARSVQAPIRLRGGREGLRLEIQTDLPWPRVLEALEAQLRQGRTFFRGAHLTLDLGVRPFQAQDLRRLRDLLERYQVTLVRVESLRPEGRQRARALGLEAGQGTEGPAPDGVPGAEGLVIPRTLRSGQEVRFPGSVTILGDVNDGARVFAGGHIVVWGRLRGEARAGSLGDEGAQIAALEFAPSFLEIAGVGQTGDGVRLEGPARAYLEGGRIVISLWSRVRRRGRG